MDAKRLIWYLESDACVHWNVDSLKSLVNECQASRQLDATFEGATPLAVACQTECEPAVKLLLEAGANVNLQSGYFERGPLHWCMLVEEEDIGISVAMATILLEHGAEVNQRDDRGCTPLHLACQAQKQQCAELLLRNGATLDAVDESFETPLIKACQSYSHEVIEILVKAGCDVNHDYGAALKILLMNPDVSLKTIKLLISKGANLRVQNYLCTACSHNNSTEVIEYLISEGADVNASGNLLGITALQHACLSPKVGCDTIELLLQHGADIDVLSSTGDSALHYAAQAANLRKVSVLLNWGAELHLVDDCGFTPLGALLTTRVEENLFRDYMRTAHLLLAAGATLSGSELDTVRKAIPMPLSPSQIEINIARFLECLEKQCRQPSRLLDICRIKVRSCIVDKKDMKVRQLFLPDYLKEFLLFSDI